MRTTFQGLSGGDAADEFVAHRRMLLLCSSRLELIFARTIPLQIEWSAFAFTPHEAQEIDLAPAKQSSPAPSSNAADADAESRAQTRLWLRLLACTSMIEAELRRRFREEYDFTMPRFDVLAQLDREPSGLVLGELPKRLMVSAGNLTPIVDRLVEDGYITRTPSHLDRRVQIVCMTVEGRKSFRRMAKSHGAWLAELLAEFPMDRLDGLVGALDDVKSAVRDALQRPERS